MLTQTRRFTLRSLATLGLLAASVTIPAAAQYSTPMRDVDNPARQPFTISKAVFMPNNSPQGQDIVFVVPLGKRLVIETYTINFTLYNSQRLTAKLDVGPANHFLAVTHRSNNPYVYAEATNAVRFYVDPGQTLVLRLTRDPNDVQGEAGGHFTFSGYFVNLP